MNDTPAVPELVDALERALAAGRRYATAKDADVRSRAVWIAAHKEALFAEVERDGAIAELNRVTVAFSGAPPDPELQLSAAELIAEHRGVYESNASTLP